MLFHSELPLLEEVEIADPLSAARALSHLPYPFLLHSALRDERARWSYFGADPFAVFSAEGYEDARALWRALSRRVIGSDPPPTAVPFTGGIVGYWAYDFGRRLERLPTIARDDLLLPDVFAPSRGSITSSDCCPRVGGRCRGSHATSSRSPFPPPSPPRAIAARWSRCGTTFAWATSSRPTSRSAGPARSSRRIRARSRWR
ncbi:MAG: hypothetical protein E6K80_05905 [Candidatus Eisenbacteria bacterium]|uniref:Anthranilate synthase component I N-terminal domain-containing protein n=1 Tax=Eiseniibacteriota bacterium TaxID=2212470 RepID=A0A538U633_UNCEI|nr:MAG: hypothetical protein E6K80_05905 [Candidatus Eisenbacteria bacterium]